MSNLPTTTEKPNALEIEMLSEKCREYVNRYRRFAKASAESFIDLAKTVKEAEIKLRKSDFGVFCFHVGLERNSSTFRKLITIADNADRLRPHVLSLPPAWTTLYELAQMSHGDFGKVVESGIISPSMTAKDVKAVLPPDETKPKKTSKKKQAETDLEEQVAAGRITVAKPTEKPLSNAPEVPRKDFTITLDLAGCDRDLQKKVHGDLCLLALAKSVPMKVGVDLRSALDEQDTKPASGEISDADDEEDPISYFERLAAGT